jgi:hypothetical protein
VARNNTLSELLRMLRAEARVSTSTSAGLDNKDHLVQVIRRHYDTLYQNYDWPFMQITREDAGITLAAGQRYYDFPDDLNPEMPFVVWYKYAGIWYKLEQGIGPSEYSVRDSDIDERSDPAMRWDWYGESQIEIWPLPATDDGEVRFEGTKKKTELNNDNDRADLDDLLIVLFAAAEVLASKGQKDAQMKATLANQRLNMLRGNVASQKRVVFGKGGEQHPKTRTIRIARVST